MSKKYNTLLDLIFTTEDMKLSVFVGGKHRTVCSKKELEDILEVYTRTEDFNEVEEMYIL